MPRHLKWAADTNGAFTAAASYYDLDLASEAASPPETGDFLTFEDNAQAVITGLTGFAGTNAILLAELHFDQTYTGAVGGKTTPLYVGASRVTVGRYFGDGNPAGSGRVNLYLTNATDATAAANIEVYDTAQTPTDTDLEPVRLLARNAAHVLSVRKGNVGIATSQAYDGSVNTVTFASVDIGYTDSGDDDARVHCAEGVTLATWNQRYGEGVLRSSVTNATISSGKFWQVGGSTAATLTVDLDAKAYLSSANSNTAAATITTLNLVGSADMDRSGQARTITNANLYAGAGLTANRANVTFSNGLDLIRCGVGDVSLNLGKHLTLTPSAV